jgi:hypothetical protein
MSDNLDLSTVGTAIVIRDFYEESSRSQLARFRRLEVEDGDLATFFTKCLNHRLSSLFAAEEIIGHDMRNHLGIRCGAADIHSENRDLSGVCPPYCRANGFPITWNQDDRQNILFDKIVDLFDLRFDVEIRTGEDDAMTVLICLGDRRIGESSIVRVLQSYR